MSTQNFVEIDAQAIEDALIQRFESTYGQTLYPGDVRRIFLQQLVPFLVGTLNSINDTGNANLLSNARGTRLEALGDLFDVTRLPAQNAICTMRFTLAAGAPTPITVPAGTRVTPDGSIYFSTNGVMVITGAYGDASCTAADAGSGGNNFAIGQISQLVDPVPYVASVSNTTASSGGSDIESDDDLRARIRMAPSSFSVAGPEGAYKYWATIADASISDVSVYSPANAPGEVHVVILLEGGILPGQGVLDAVMVALDDKTKRPLTDKVVVEAAVASPYNIVASYYISEDWASQTAAIRDAIEGTSGAVAQYVARQRAVLGRDINPDKLRQYMMDCGADRVIITSPVFTALNENQVAQEVTVTINYMGLE